MGSIENSLTQFKTAYDKPIVYILAFSTTYVKRNTAISTRYISSKFLHLRMKFFITGVIMVSKRKKGGN